MVLSTSAGALGHLPCLIGRHLEKKLHVPGALCPVGCGGRCAFAGRASRLVARPRQDPGAVGAGRVASRRDRCHQHHARGGCEPACARRTTGFVQSRRCRLQRGAAEHAGRVAAPRRWPALSQAHQRPRRAGALRRRDPRGQLVDRPVGARVHDVVRSAGDCARAGACAGNDHGAVDVVCCPGPASIRRTGPARAGARGAACRGCITARAAAFGEAGRCRGADRCRRVQGQAGRFVVEDRRTHAAARRFARPDAGIAVPRQSTSVHGQQHEPVESGRRARGSQYRSSQWRLCLGRSPGDPGPECRLRRLPPAPRRCRANGARRRLLSPGQRQGGGLGR